jgi:hypothetical protein
VERMTATERLTEVESERRRARPLMTSLARERAERESVARLNSGGTAGASSELSLSLSRNFI